MTKLTRREQAKDQMIEAYCRSIAVYRDVLIQIRQRARHNDAVWQLANNCLDGKFHENAAPSGWLNS